VAVGSRCGRLTYFFNPTQPDEQNPKPSPRARGTRASPGLGLGLGPRTELDLTTQANPSGGFCMSWPNPQKRTPNPRIFVCGFPSGGASVRTKIHVRSDPTRRTKRAVSRFNLSDVLTVYNPSRPGQKGANPAQPCPGLGLNARARVQPNPTGHSTLP
jgi:hypothetical protein